MTSRTKLKRKEVDDVMGGEDSWKNVDSTDAPCPKCENPKAYFMQLQIRSADEPSECETSYTSLDAFSSSDSCISVTAQSDHILPLH